jgi:hypothetical protein
VKRRAVHLLSACISSCGRVLGETESLEYLDSRHRARRERGGFVIAHCFHPPPSIHTHHP